MSDTSEDGGEVATNLVISEIGRSTNHPHLHNHHQFSNNSNNNNNNSSSNVTTSRSNNNHIQNNTTSETQIPVHHQLPVGKVIDNFTGSASSSHSLSSIMINNRNNRSNSNNNINSAATTMESVLDLRTGSGGVEITSEIETTESEPRLNSPVVAEEVVLETNDANSNSGSEIEERVPSNISSSNSSSSHGAETADALSRVEVELHEVVAQASAVLNNNNNSISSPPAALNSIEIAIDTDTDDDVILVAPPMEVIEVQDEDDEDVQIVSQSHAALPKPLPGSSSTTTTSTTSSNNTTSNSSGGSNTNSSTNNKNKSRLLPAPPTLPDISEIDEVLPDNIPVLLGDLFDSHFGHFDFDLPAIELPPSHAAVLPSTSNYPHHNNTLAESITNASLKRSAEIAIQTETVYKSIETQTDEIVEPPKKRKWSYTEEDDGDGTACPICYEPWEESGEHRLVSLKCGHLFGESCLTMWFNQQNQTKNRIFCPVCRTKAMLHHIRPIFARRVVQIKYDKINELRAEMLKWKRNYQSLQSSYNRLQHHQTQAAATAAAQIQLHAPHPSHIPQTSAQVAAANSFLVHHPTSAVHSTTAQQTPISSSIERPRIINIANVYPPEYRDQLLRRFLPPNYAPPPPFGMENEYHI